MKYKLPRQVFTQDIQKLIYQELKKQGSPAAKASKQRLKEISDVSKVIETQGLPDHLVLKKLSNELGYGIFLHPEAKPLKKGLVIAPYSGAVTLAPQNDPDDSGYAFSALSDIMLKKKEQLFLDKKKKFAPRRLYSLNLDAKETGNFTRFINHSSDRPNVEALLLAVPKNTFGLEQMPIEVVYLTKKIIKPGEQFLVCYEDEEESYWRAYGVEPYPMGPKTFMIDKDLNLIKS